MEHPCHLEGMLDRDQRTAKLRYFDRSDSDEESVPKAYSFRAAGAPAPAERHWCRPTRTRRSVDSSHLACRNGYLLNTFQSVTNVLIIVFLTLTAIPIVSSAPTMGSTDIRALYEQKMKWMNPCDLEKPYQAAELSSSSDFSKSEVTNIINEVGNALLQAEFNETFSNASEVTAALDQTAGFSNDFAMQTFQKPLAEVKNDFMDQALKYLETEWMGPKTEDDTVPDEHLATLKIEDVLVKGDSHLQRLAVGLEQVAWDQTANKGQFAKEFETAEQQLKRLLCEMCGVMEAHGLQRETVTRDIMKEENRIMDMTARKGRDWMILRDYMRTLKYIQAALEHLKGGLSQP